MVDANALFIPQQDGMDAHLHFPHVILSGEHPVIWEQPGRLPLSFFDDMPTGGSRNSWLQIPVALWS
ncbi:hypothetical protein ACAX43_01390 [Paraburkholderia sp. IW21]|uniref:hypothetical protein n=1 Tax=Paraburkholderia sp. IW21 TaxID=3242488 RepID=UPI00352164C7